jgi:hypothetical protein
LLNQRCRQPAAILLATGASDHGSCLDPADRVVELTALAFMDACIENGEQACDRCNGDDRARVSECFSV